MRRIWQPALTFAVVLSWFPTVGSAGGTALDEWQKQRLFQPNVAQLARESRGQVFIYEGLTDASVQHAMDEHFDRVESMMFTRVLVTDAAGQVKIDPETGVEVREEDGCED